jgi:pimeloyl-ACP methyl ester carboxylesterase
MVWGLPIYVRESRLTPADGNVPVALVHGLNVSSRHMIAFAEWMAPFYRMLAPDQPGYGKSGKPDHFLSLEERADWLADWLRAEGVERAAWLGTSFGAQVLAALAERHPEVVTRAVLVSPTIEPDSRTYPELVRRWWRNSRRESKGVGMSTLRDYRDTGVRRAIFTFRQMVADRIEERLPQVTMPTLVVRGDNDPILSPAWVAEVTRLLPRARMVTIPGAAHAVNMDAPRALAEAVRPFLAGELDWNARWEAGRQAG